MGKFKDKDSTRRENEIEQYWREKRQEESERKNRIGQSSPVNEDILNGAENGFYCE